MARCKPNLFSAVSGRLGGVEFAMAKEGMVVKRRKPPKKMNSVRQITYRTVFHRRANLWHTLPEENVKAFMAWAATHPVKNRLGIARYQSAYNWFMKLLVAPSDDPGITDPPGGEILPPLDPTPPATEITVSPALVFLLSMDDNAATPVVLDSATAADGYFITVRALNPAPEATVVELWYREANPIYPNAKKSPWIFFGTYPLDTKLAMIEKETFLEWKTVVRRKDFWPSFRQQFQVSGDHVPHPQTFSDPTGDPNTDAHHVAGVHGGALHFDGINDCITLSEASIVPYLEEDQDFTLAIWWKPDVPLSGTYKVFFGNSIFLTARFGFERKNTACKLSANTYWDHGLHGHNHVFVEVNVSEWHHYAIVRRGDTIEFYRDGVCGLSVSEDNCVGSVVHNNTTCAIGRQGAIASYAAGAADDVRLYNIGLTAAEVAALAVP